MRSEDIFKALGALDDDIILEVVSKMNKSKSKNKSIISYKAVFSLAAVFAMLLALGLTAYAFDLFGFKALLKEDSEPVIVNEQEYELVSISQPQAVPETIENADYISEKLENSKAAWTEWEAYCEEHRADGLPEALRWLGEIHEGGGIFLDENPDGTLTVRFEGRTVNKESTVSMEDWEAYVLWINNSGGGYGDYDFNYGVCNEEHAAKLEEIAEKYGLNLRRGDVNLLWSSETTGMSGEGFLTNAELAEKTAEMGNAGNVFRQTPEGFDKVYWHNEGTFCISYYYTVSSGETANCYGYNSMYTTLSSGKEVSDLVKNPEDFAERSYTTADGTAVTVLSNEYTAFIYVYLDNSFFNLKIDNVTMLTEEDINNIADGLNYSLIGKG